MDDKNDLISSNSKITAVVQHGKNGTDGINGQSPILRVDSEYIQWKYPDDTDWNDLMAIADLKGDSGQDGTDGTNGQPCMLQIKENVIQWKYPDDTDWNDLMAVTDLTGDPGQDGTDGKDGVSPILQEGTDSIQWKYPDDDDWRDLITNNDLKGDTGQDGTDGIDKISGFFYLTNKVNPPNTQYEFIQDFRTYTYNTSSNIKINSDGSVLFLRWAPGSSTNFLVLISIQVTGTQSYLHAYSFITETTHQADITLQTLKYPNVEQTLYGSTFFISGQDDISFKIVTRNVTSFSYQFSVIELT